MPLTTTANAEMAAAWDGPEGAHWAEHADRYESTSSAYGDALLEALDLAVDSSALDIGCGNGGSTIAAGRVATNGSVLGVDLSSQMLAVARARAAAEGLDHVRFEQADAQVHPFAPGAFDVGFSSFGAMFFADPVAAFANLRRALRPDGRIALLGWRELARNEWIDAVRSALAAGRDLPVPPAGVSGTPFGLADPAQNEERLAAAGFVAVEHTAVDEPMCFGRDADDAYDFFGTTGIVRGLTADLDPAAKEAALDRLRQVLADHETADGVCFAGSAWMVTAANGEAH